MVEIGSWLGNGSTQVFLEELRNYPGASLLCVDTWQGNLNVQRHQDIVSKYDVFRNVPNERGDGTEPREAPSVDGVERGVSAFDGGRRSI